MTNCCIDDSDKVYQQGSVAHLTANFTDPLNNNVAIDPSVVKLLVQSPVGTAVTTYTYNPSSGLIIRTAAGMYYADLPLDESGLWTYNWVSTGVGQASSGDQQIQVEPSALQ